MTDFLLPLGDGHTPLSDDDRQGLRPTYISNRGELYAAEQANIAKALVRRRPTVARLLDDKYLRDLHRAMFEDVWDWAGSYRRRETSIGCDPAAIAPAVRDLVEDAKVWVEHDTFERDELAVRFHHRLVVIHPFPNGNGRHSRICADYLVRGLGGGRFSWGANHDATTDAVRAEYLRALRRADGHDDFAPLVAFARS